MRREDGSQADSRGPSCPRGKEAPHEAPTGEEEGSPTVTQDAAGPAAPGVASDDTALVNVTAYRAGG
eukprot:9900779-Lingulodinium_polyedra.AAC.1